MKARLYMVTALVSMFMASCQMTENIDVKEDGTGKISFDVDASELMAMAGDKMMEGGKAKEIDSTFTFRQLLAEKKDSIAKLPIAEQERLKKMENLSVNMKMSAKNKEFKMSVFTDFKKASELQDMMQGMKSIKDLEKSPAQDASNPFGGMLKGADNTELKYSYDGMTFKRTVKIKDKQLFEQTKDTTGMMKMMFGSSKYTMKYHFPRKVKSVSNPNALFSDDRKTITVPYSLIDYLEQPEKMSLEVVLDKK